MSETIIECAECRTPYEINQVLDSSEHPDRWAVKVCDCATDEVVMV